MDLTVELELQPDGDRAHVERVLRLLALLRAAAEAIEETRQLLRHETLR